MWGDWRFTVIYFIHSCTVLPPCLVVDRLAARPAPAAARLVLDDGVCGAARPGRRVNASRRSTQQQQRPTRLVTTAAPGSDAAPLSPPFSRTVSSPVAIFVASVDMTGGGTVDDDHRAVDWGSVGLVLGIIVTDVAVGCTVVEVGVHVGG